jgi:hypothetical protein
MRTLWVLLLSLLAYSISGFATVKITTATLPNGTVGTAYSGTIAAKSGCTPYAWTVSGTVPPGVAFGTTNNTQALSFSGTPTSASTYSFSVLVKGCGGNTSQLSYTVVVQPEPYHVVNLSWTSSTSNNVAGYNMYRGPDGVNWTKVNAGGVIASTIYSDSTCSNQTTYYYAATTVDISGNESAKSTPVQVAIP